MKLKKLFLTLLLLFSTSCGEATVNPVSSAEQEDISRRRRLIIIASGSEDCSGATDPCVESVSGVLGHRNTITISGQAFGSGPTVFLVDDFDDGTNGNAISLSGSVVGQWHSYGDTGACTQTENPSYSTSNNNSGSLAMQIHQQACFRPGIVADINSAELFYYYHIFIPINSCIECSSGRCPSTCGGVNWKINWLLGTGKSTSSGDRYLAFTEGDQRNGTGSNSADTYFAGEFIGDVEPSTGLTQSNRNIWWEHYINVAANGFGDVEFTGKKGGSSDTRQTFISRVNVELQPDADWSVQSDRYHYLDISSYGSEKDVWIDDVYIAQGANARARVMIANASTLANATDMAICTTGDVGESWSTTSITCTIRGGSFAGNWWLYVFDTDGDVSTGFAL